MQDKDVLGEMNGDGCLNIIWATILHCFSKPTIKIEEARANRIKFVNESDLFPLLAEFYGIKKSLIQEPILNFCNMMVDDFNDYDKQDLKYYFKKYGNDSKQP